MKGIHGGGEFGYTNDPDVIAAVRAWRDAALADGWASTPAYANEDEASACKLLRDGWYASVLTREARPGGAWDSRHWKYWTHVSVWGPDRLCVVPPDPYSFDALVAGLRTCGACGKTDVDTQRVGFAGRCCVACLPEQRRLHEYPGWTN